MQQAYELLSDEAARKAYDAVRQIRREREARMGAQSSKRQKMVAELEKREREAEKQKSQEDSARQQLKKELERLRKEAAEKRAQAWAASGAGGIGLRSKANGGQAVSEEMRRTLKVTWQIQEGGGEGYTAGRLREMFEECGKVEDVVVRERKMKKARDVAEGTARGSALVVMASLSSAVSTLRSDGATPCCSFWDVVASLMHVL